MSSFSSQEQQTRELNREMIEGLQQLTKAADLATSGELSPVVFRFRTGIRPYISLPIADTSVVLKSQSDDLIHRIATMEERTDFGLIPPGRYQLEALTGIYKLNWDFQIHPGARVDRVMLVPPAVPPLGLRINLCLDSTQDVAGVCLVRALPRVVDGRMWHVHSLPGYAIVCDDQTSEIDAQRIINLDPLLQQLVVRGEASLCGSVPFFDCEVLCAYCISSQDVQRDDVVSRYRFACESNVSFPAAPDLECISLERHMELHWDSIDIDSIRTLALQESLDRQS